MSAHPAGVVTAVNRNETYSFSKPQRDAIELIAGLGVEEDVHAGARVRHRGRVIADPHQPNLRQVHLIHAELFDDLRAEGYDVQPGQLGENVTTSGVDLLRLARGTILRFGPAAAESAAGRARTGLAEGPAVSGEARDSIRNLLAVAERAVLTDAARNAVAALLEAAGRVGPPGVTTVVVTGLRNPCRQIDAFRPGLLKHVVGRDADGNLVRKGGVMAVVLHGGPIRPGDPVVVEPPPGPRLTLEPV